jgi:1,4-dihydroxy-2-naphthoate octaprenyltransferase
MLFCITAQLGTNLHNDYSDFIQGADTEKRVGHARATAKGWLTPSQTCAAATGALCVTLLSGIYLAVATEQTDNWVVWFVIISSIFNAFAYTGGPYPLGYIGLEKCSIGYAGLGDIFVFLYFGLVGTWMLPYLLMCQGSNIEWWSQGICGTQVGLLATNIIVVNNLRDRHTDAIAGKRTTTVRFGRSFSLAEYFICIVLAYALVLLDFHWSRYKLETLLPLLSLPLALTEMKAVQTKEGTFLNDHVGGTAKVQLAFCILLSISLLISR